MTTSANDTAINAAAVRTDLAMHIPSMHPTGAVRPAFSGSSGDRLTDTA
jgi:hypothetical protein